MNSKPKAKPPARRPKAGAKRSSDRHSLVVRQARLGDVPAIAALSRKIYAPGPWHTQRMVRSQIVSFPDGQFVAELDGEVVGHCATFRIDEKAALGPHSWDEITGDGLASRHDDKGDWLYGMEISVDPDHRRLRIGQRLYDARRILCERLGIKGIVFGGRMPGYARRQRQYPDAADYLAAVVERRVRDSAIGFHLSNDFEPLGILTAYDPDDYDSRGYAAHMIWRSPLYVETSEGATPEEDALATADLVRVATVQFQMRQIAKIEEFEAQIEYFVDVAADYRCDFVVFPELFTLQLLSMEGKPLPPAEGVARVAEYTEWYEDFMHGLAMRYNINIIGGSHPSRDDDGDIRNTAYVFLRDGSIYRQDKIHPTPDEVYWWNIRGGDAVTAIDTDCGPIGVLVCYDSEFPELARHLIDQGAMILFVPFCTDERRGYLRVRYCCQARAVENQCYVVMSGVVGNLPNVENMDIHYAESCILTPSDLPFARDGVAADTAPNTEMIAFADLKLSDLRVARSEGSVRNLRDRRFDLYRVVWNRRIETGTK
ncbi:MAG: bifunctional GNAT family N-acetyltransferase/carbon-nitrogen hydrolase family protein [Rhodospirillaceae bacterium]